MFAGISHIGLSTKDMDGTLKFYRDVIGFPVARFDHVLIDEGGEILHVFFDMGHHQFLAFNCYMGIEGITGPTDPGINTALGVPQLTYHIAFNWGSPQALEAMRARLTSNGIPVSDIVDHQWITSMYFSDPVNGLSLEATCYGRDLTPEDAELKVRFTFPRKRLINSEVYTSPQSLTPVIWEPDQLPSLDKV